MKYILILSLLFPLSLMAMEDQDLDGTLYIESRLHYLRDGFYSQFAQNYIPGKIAITYPPKTHSFTYNKDQQCFVDSDNRKPSTSLTLLSLTSLLEQDRYSENREGEPYYKLYATIVSVTKHAFRYRCTVDKSPPFRGTKAYEESISLPANDACTRCKLVFTNIEAQPTAIYPDTMTPEQRKTIMATLDPKLWINIKAEYVPKGGSPKYMTGHLANTQAIQPNL